MRGKWVRTLVYLAFIAMLASCYSCSTKPSKAEQLAIEKALQVERLIMAVKRAGCKNYTVENETYRDVENTRVACMDPK